MVLICPVLQIPVQLHIVNVVGKPQLKVAKLDELVDLLHVLLDLDDFYFGAEFEHLVLFLDVELEESLGLPVPLVLQANQALEVLAVGGVGQLELFILTLNYF